MASLLFRAGEQILDAKGRLTLSAAAKLNRLAEAEESLSKTYVAKDAGSADWAAPTGTATRTTFVTGSVTLPQLAERVKALIDDNMTSGAIK